MTLDVVVFNINVNAEFPYSRLSKYGILAVDMLKLNRWFRQRNKEVHEWEERFCQLDINVKNLRRQLQKIIAQLHGARSARSVRHQRLQGRTMEHQDRLREVFERATTQWQNEVVESAVTGIDHVLQHFCRHERDDDDAGLVSGGHAVWYDGQDRQ